MMDHLSAPLLRRAFLGRGAAGLGALALSTLLPRGLGAAEQWPAAVQPLHHKPTAKRIIYLFQSGGPSHIDLFDNKPGMAALDGKPMPESLTKGQPIAQLQGQALKVLAPQHPYRRWGKSGLEISEVLPNIGGVADDICVIRSMVTDAINHDPAQSFMNSGSSISGRPSMGSWFLYGLGSACQDLPGFIVLTSVGGGQAQPIASRQWSAGMLPSRFQGVPFHAKGDPVLYVGRPPGVGVQQQREVIDAVNALNGLHDGVVADPEIATRISQYEMAFKMQASVPELVDFSKEPKSVLDLYGTKGADGTFAANCLMARRLAERGVRFIQCYHRGWDHHGGVKKGVMDTGRLVDQGTAALITDLKQRGMLDDTLVIWGGEFGRTPMAQGDGRDHHIKGFSLFMAGGGIKPGISHGATDDFGYNAIQDPVHVHDLHATIMHVMGIDHTRLTVRFQGRDFRLTDVHGQVVKAILA
jgi:hypothetical protein